MTSNRQVSDLTRQELYNLVWSKPMIKLSKTFGISDVAIAKRCRKLNIPRPPRGYWAKIAARYKPQKTPLPRKADDVFTTGSRAALKKALSLPENLEGLHPLAAELLRVLNIAKPDAENRVTVCQRDFPATIVTKALAERVSKAFSAILQMVEPLGINFRRFLGPYAGGCFQKGNDRLYVKIEERLFETPVLNSYRMIGQYQRTPSGVLTFVFTTHHYSDSETKEWVERKRVPLEKLLAHIVTYIRRHYVRAQRRRAKDAIERRKERVESEKRRKEWQEKEVVRMEEERKQKHAEALEAVVRDRMESLFRAAVWWRLHEVVHEFILECERRWRHEQDRHLRPEQEEWLMWARETSADLSPFSACYPEPGNDGVFEPAAVPFGGPYPPSRDFPQPPTMAVNPPTVIPASTQHHL